jgi:hypothetical protein
MILRITQAEVCGDFLLRVVFNNNTMKVVDVRSMLDGPVFEPLHDREFFSRMELDPVCGTVVWPNGADFAPEAIYSLSAEEKPVGANN